MIARAGASAAVIRLAPRARSPAPLLYPSRPPTLTACAPLRNPCIRLTPIRFPPIYSLPRTVSPASSLIWSHPFLSFPTPMLFLSFPRIHRGFTLVVAQPAFFYFSFEPDFEPSVTTVVSVLFHRFRSIVMERCINGAPDGRNANTTISRRLPKRSGLQPWDILLPNTRNHRIHDDERWHRRWEMKSKEASRSCRALSGAGPRCLRGSCACRGSRPSE